MRLRPVRTEKIAVLRARPEEAEAGAPGGGSGSADAVSGGGAGAGSPARAARRASRSSRAASRCCGVRSGGGLRRVRRIAARYSTRPPRPESRPLCVMANIHSQEKRILRAERERNENRRYTSAIKTYFRRLEAALAEDDADQIEAEHRRLAQHAAASAAALQLEVGHQLERAAERVDVPLRDVGDQAVGGERRHPQTLP